jgi:acetyl-CoA carboxylase alpha subunit
MGHIERIDSKNQFEKKLNDLRDEISQLKSQSLKSSEKLSEQLQQDQQQNQKSLLKQVSQLSETQEDLSRKLKK